MHAETTLRQVPGFGTIETENQLLEDLRGMILNSGLTFGKLGELANVGPNTISRWVSRQTRSPQLLKAAAVAEALGYRLTFVPTQARNAH